MSKFISIGEKIEHTPKMPFKFRNKTKIKRPILRNKTKTPTLNNKTKINNTLRNKAKINTYPKKHNKDKHLP